METYGKGTGFGQWGPLMATVFGAAILLLSACQKEQKSQTPPPQPGVEVVEVIQKDVPIYSEWIATTDGFVNATIRTQVQGYLIKQNYREGDFVKKDQALFEIDPRTFQAALDQALAARDQARASRNQAVAAREQAKASLEQAKATVDQAQADVARTEARYSIAKINLGRVRPLVEKKALSQKDLDDAVGNEESARATVVAAKAGVSAAQARVSEAQAAVVAAQAAVGAAEAAMGAAQANVDKAQLEYSFTKILSPIDGIAGIAKAQLGNLVGPGQIEELTTVSTVDPIKVYISLSEQEYLRAAEHYRKAQKMPLELILADGSIHPHKGEFFLADRQVDTKTGTIRIGALFKNPRNILRPGQFARVRAEVRIKKGALLVPQRAVTELQGSYQVAVVGPDRKVDIRPVKTGERVQTLWVIDQGLKPGEQVIAEGTQKVRQGMSVNPKPFTPPAKPEGSGKAGAQPGAEAKPEKR